MHHSIQRRDVGRIAIACVTSEAGERQCTSRADPDAQVTICIQLQGSATLKQGERQAELTDGYLCLLRNAPAINANLVGRQQQVLVDVPETAFVDRSPLWKVALLKAIPFHEGAPAIFVEAIHALRRGLDQSSDRPPRPAALESMANAVIELSDAVVCSAVPVNADCMWRWLQQREQVKRFAEQHRRDPEFNVELIAAGVNRSVRQVHRLFSGEPLSLMRWVWVRRLENCYRELAGTDSAIKRSIAEIAYSWGFNDQAHFSRAFRNHFAMSPRDAHVCRDSDLGNAFRRAEIRQGIRYDSLSSSRTPLALARLDRTMAIVTKRFVSRPLRVPRRRRVLC